MVLALLPRLLAARDDTRGPAMDPLSLHGDGEEIHDVLQMFRLLSGTSRSQWEMGVSRYTRESTHEL